MKITDFDAIKVAAWCRIDLPDESDEYYEQVMTEIQMIMDSVIAVMCKRTGRNAKYIKDQDDLTYCFLGLCAEEFENRQYRVSVGQYKNEFLMEALDAHSVNFIPGEAEIAEDEGEDEGDIATDEDIEDLIYNLDEL